MSLAAIVCGVSAAAMLALGFNVVLPLSAAVDSLCTLVGIASAVAFIGLVEGS